MSGKGTEVCEELRKRRMDVCCLQEVRWGGQGVWLFGLKDRRYKLWSGNSDGTGGVCWWRSCAKRLWRCDEGMTE